MKEGRGGRGGEGGREGGKGERGGREGGKGGRGGREGRRKREVNMCDLSSGVYLETFNSGLSVEEGSAICIRAHKVTKALTQISQVSGQSRGSVRRRDVSGEQAFVGGVCL